MDSQVSYLELNMYKISVIMSVRNGLNYLPYAINSILRQTHENFEFLIFDDGSNCETASYLREMESTDSRIKVFSDGSTKGLPARLNQLIDYSSGDYIARMDGDDICHSSRLQCQLNYMLKNLDTDVIDSTYYVINDNNEVIGFRKGVDVDNLSFKRALDTTIFLHPAVFAKSAWFKNNKYDEDFKRGQDRELWCRCIRSSRYARVDVPLIMYRDDPHKSQQNYHINMKYGRRTILRHGPELVGKRLVLYLLVRSYFKQFAYGFCYLFNATHFLSKKRNLPLDSTVPYHMFGVK